MQVKMRTHESALQTVTASTILSKDQQVFTLCGWKEKAQDMRVALCWRPSKASTMKALKLATFRKVAFPPLSWVWMLLWQSLDVWSLSLEISLETMLTFLIFQAPIELLLQPKRICYPLISTSAAQSTISTTYICTCRSSYL